MSQSDGPVYGAESDRERRYASALLHASGRVPEDTVDWDAFHTRLAARAEFSLARLRHRQITTDTPGRPRSAPSIDRSLPLPWWAHAARWSRLVILGSAAAGIALIMVVRTSPKEASAPDTVVASATPTPETEGRRAMFESAALGRGTTWSIESALLPSATDLLVPLGKGAVTQ